MPSTRPHRSFPNSRLGNGTLSCPSRARTCCSTPSSCRAISSADAEPVVRRLRRPALEPHVERRERREQRAPARLGDAGPVGGQRTRSVGQRHRDRAGQAEEVGLRRRSGPAHLRRLEPLGPVRRATGPDALDRAQVDDLHGVTRAHHVLGLEVAVEQPLVVQVGQGVEQRDAVREHPDDPRRVHLPRRQALLPPQLAEVVALDVLHDDVVVAVARDEVDDLDDVGVVHLGEEPPLVDQLAARPVRDVADEALEHHPAQVDATILRHVQPAHATVPDGADHLVALGDLLARVQPRCEGEGRPAPRAASLRRGGDPLHRPADRLLARRAEPPSFRDRGVERDVAERVSAGHGGEIHPAGRDDRPTTDTRQRRVVRWPPAALAEAVVEDVAAAGDARRQRPGAGHGAADGDGTEPSHDTGAIGEWNQCS